MGLTEREGSTSAGDSCGYASEHYLINSQGEKYAWCASHLKILAGYDLNKHTIVYGYDKGENQ